MQRGPGGSTRSEFRSGLGAALIDSYPLERDQQNDLAACMRIPEDALLSPSKHPQRHTLLDPLSQTSQGKDTISSGFD